MSISEIQSSLDNLLYKAVPRDNGSYHLKIKKLRIEDVQKELVSSKLHLLTKDKLLSEIKSFLLSLSGCVPDAKQQKEVNAFIYKIEANRREREWKEFEKHFNLLHSDFFKKIKKDYPLLSIAEVKLCGLIKIKLTTKEMANYLNLSLRGIETQRYRLRKKMQIANGTTLEDFFDSI